MRGSRNVPASQLRGADGRLKDRDALMALFERTLDGRPPVATCGSGISAALVALALHVIGHHDVPVFDGSWAQWGRDPRTEALTDVSG